MVQSEGFQELAEHFVENDFEPARGLIVPKRGMAVRLSPMEIRFEKMLRILVPQVASLTSRVRELEARLGTGPAADPMVLEPPQENPTEPPTGEERSPEGGPSPG